VSTIPAVSLGTGRTAKSISAGFHHTCAILDDDRLKCWGAPTAGELGLGSLEYRGFASVAGNGMGDSLPAVDLGSGRHALEVQAHGMSTCALLDDQHLKCWGANNLGQLGLGDNASRGDDPLEMGEHLPFLSLDASSKVKAFSTGQHACALLVNDELKCWGDNGYGELGLGDYAIRGDNAGEMGLNLPAVVWR
jgi:E3 ubiquitin-protein ligase HERC3